MKEKVFELVKQNNLEYIHLEYIDYVGVTRSRMIPSYQLEKAFEAGVSFSKPTLGFNSFDDWIPNSTFGVGDGDFYCIPDPETFFIYPNRNNTGRMLTKMVEGDGADWEGCPRTVLKNVIQQAETLLGGKIYIGFEQEAYLLSEKEGKLVPADFSACFTTDGVDIQEDFIQSFSTALAAAGIEVIQVSSEYGPGQIEVNIKHAEALSACDHQITFAQLFKQVARKKGFVGTLIPKPFADAPGSGLHIHLSVLNENGDNLFLDTEDQQGLDLSEKAYQFIAGILKHGDALTALTAPSINSYKRLQPGTFAPAHQCYGLGNRSTLIRVIEGEKNKRIEFRGADGSGNPYLMMAALIAAGMDGIQNQLVPGPPIQQDASILTPEEMEECKVKWLPRSLGDSIRYLAQDEVLRNALGDTIWREYLRLKDNEWIKYCKYVSDWEVNQLSRVF